jgi:molybdopterin molybdotransferase/putative molybdopterin biosynthesis protein
VFPTHKIASRLGVDEFVRVKLGSVDGKIVATPLPRGAGNITSITEADGVIQIPSHEEGLHTDSPVSAELLRPKKEVEKTIVAVGSHDNAMDVLADELRRSGCGYTLSSSHVGSMGGLMAVKRGVCHLAGSHLLDTKDGSYNLSYLKRYLPDTPVRLVNMVKRDQGLIVGKGNPKGIKGLEDLLRDDIRMVNRQSGSGTRILLDHKLAEEGIEAAKIKGYASDEYTHMAVAMAVLSRRADVGMGIYAAAKALNLDFIPVIIEQYDIVIPRKYFETDSIQALIEILRSRDFQTRVTELGGYHTEKTGQVIL